MFQKLLSSMVTDSFGMDLMRTMLDFIPWSILSPYFVQIWILLFTRAKNSMTDSFSQDLLSFLGHFIYTQGVDCFTSSIESVQPGMFLMVMEKIMLAKIDNVLSPVARRSVALGLIRLVFDSKVLMSDPYVSLLTPSVKCILDLVEKEKMETGSRDETLQKMQAEGFSNVFCKLRYSNVKIESKLKDANVKEIFERAVKNLQQQSPDAISFIANQLPAQHQSVLLLYLK